MVAFFSCLTDALFCFLITCIVQIVEFFRLTDSSGFQNPHRISWLTTISRAIKSLCQHHNPTSNNLHLCAPYVWHLLKSLHRNTYIIQYTTPNTSISTSQQMLRTSTCIKSLPPPHAPQYQSTHPNTKVNRQTVIIPTYPGVSEPSDRSDRARV